MLDAIFSVIVGGFIGINIFGHILVFQAMFKAETAPSKDAVPASGSLSRV